MYFDELSNQLKNAPSIWDVLVRIALWLGLVGTGAAAIVFLFVLTITWGIVLACFALLLVAAISISYLEAPPGYYSK